LASCSVLYNARLGTACKGNVHGTSPFMYAHAVRYADTRKGTMTALRVTVDQVARIGFVSVVDFTWNRPIDFPDTCHLYGAFVARRRLSDSEWSFGHRKSHDRLDCTAMSGRPVDNRRASCASRRVNEI